MSQKNESVEPLRSSILRSIFDIIQIISDHLSLRGDHNTLLQWPCAKVRFLIKGPPVFQQPLSSSAIPPMCSDEVEKRSTDDRENRCG